MQKTIEMEKRDIRMDACVAAELVEQYRQNGKTIRLWNVLNTLFKDVEDEDGEHTFMNIYDYLAMALDADIEAAKLLLIKYNDLFGYNKTYIRIRDLIAEKRGICLRDVQIENFCKVTNK